jgi:ferrous-iron efflux pump FieF
MSTLVPEVNGNGRFAIRAALASVMTAALLIVLKGFAALQTGSVAMLGSLADSGLDLLASAISLYGVRVAAMPADREHRFGHGKAEALAALVQVGIISISAGAIAWHAIGRLLAGAITSEAGFGIGVSLIAIAATFALLAYQRRVIARTGSVAIRTDHVHYQSDLLLNLSVILALALDQYAGIRGADPVLGIGIALWLAWSAWKASSHAVDQLMDKEWPEEKRRRFREIATRHPELKGVHELRTRTSGSRDFAQFHIWVDPTMSVRRAHVVMDEIEALLKPEFPDTEILIHLDPEGHVDPPTVPPAPTEQEAAAS